MATYVCGCQGSRLGRLLVGIYVVLIGYVVGLLLTGLTPEWSVGALNGLGVGPVDFTVGIALMLGLGAIAAILCPRFWRMGPRPSVWVMAGLVGVMAGVYMQVRSPSYDRLLHSIPPTEHPIFPVEVGVQGDIIDAPQLTRSNRVRFALHVTAIQIWEESQQSVEQSVEERGSDSSSTPSSPSVTTADVLSQVTHKLSVTVPLLQATGLAPGDVISLHGRLYRPNATDIPGAFNFQQYLERQSIFAILQAKGVQPSDDQSSWPRSLLQSWRRSTWAMRQRIVRSFVSGLDSPAGPLLSAMVLGRKAVDLPFDVRDQFIQAGLAHMLAASGFHVSLLLGMVLWLTQGLSAEQRLWLGSGVLMGYASLTGLQPSVGRAVLMGIAVLIASATDRKVRPLAALLLIATALLVVNPGWIWDLGFQLSFLATVGLVIMVPALVKRLDWLPVGLATAIAVPIAAMVWTLPILLRMMGTILPYSVVLGVCLTPFIGLMSLAGMATGAIALISPTLASLCVALWYWPLHILIAMVRWCNGLPGQAIALGSPTVWQLVGIYGVYLWLVWTGYLLSTSRSPASSSPAPPSPASVPSRLGAPISLRRARPFVSVAALTLVLIPLFYSRYQKVQITVFPTSNQVARPPFMLIQNRGHVGLINNGTVDEVNYTLLPFLRHEGINRLDWAIATPAWSADPSLQEIQDPVPTDTVWNELTHTIPIKQMYFLPDPPLEQAPSLSSSSTIQENTTPDIQPQSLETTAAHPSWQPLTMGRSIAMGQQCTLTVLATAPAILELVVDEHHWIVMDHTVPLASFSTLALPPSDVWYWAGNDLETHTQFLQQLPQESLPQDAIITPLIPHNDAVRSLKLSSIALYSPSRHHVVQWMPKTGFFTASDNPDPDMAL